MKNLIKVICIIIVWVLCLFIFPFLLKNIIEYMSGLIITFDDPFVCIVTWLFSITGGIGLSGSISEI